MRGKMLYMYDSEEEGGFLNRVIFFLAKFYYWLLIVTLVFGVILKILYVDILLEIDCRDKGFRKKAV